jgi:hypothetical protein
MIFYPKRQYPDCADPLCRFSVPLRLRPQSQSKLLRMAEEFADSIANTTYAIADDGERFRNGDIISSSFAESAINQVISRRMVQKQQMAWSPDAAHNLL